MADINTQIELIVRRSKATQLELQRVTERKLLALYRDAANDIGAMLLSAEPQGVAGLKTVLAQIEERVRELNETGSRLIQTHIEQSVSVGIRAQEGAVRLSWPTGLTSMIGGSPFGQIYHDAVLAMTVKPWGIELSERIWDMHQASLIGMRQIMLRGMIGGQSYWDIYRTIKAQLLLPHVDMRTRFWRQYFRENPPGRGVYRSAFKNVQRVLRTESNRAFRQAAAAYAHDKPWAKGVKWILSAAHPMADVCDELASQDTGLGPGVYLAGEAPLSPHPHCLCHLVTVVNEDYFRAAVAQRSAAA